MLKSFLYCLSVISFLSFPALSLAQTDPALLVEKAIKAHGGEGYLEKFKAIQARNIGTLYKTATPLEFTQEVFLQLPGQMKDILHIETGGKKFTILTVLNAERGWTNVNGSTQEMDARTLAEMREVAYLGQVGQLICLRKKEFTLTPRGVLRIGDRAAQGLRVSSAGHRDIDVYFDQEAGLLVKTERKSLDVSSGKEILEERTISQYSDKFGYPMPKKFMVHMDGKMVLQTEVIEARRVEKLDNSLFTRP